MTRIPAPLSLLLPPSRPQKACTSAAYCLTLLVADIDDQSPQTAREATGTASCHSELASCGGAAARSSGQLLVLIVSSRRKGRPPRHQVPAQRRAPAQRVKEVDARRRQPEIHTQWLRLPRPGSLQRRRLPACPPTL